MRKITITATLIVMPKEEQRSIQFLTLEDVLVNEIHRRMCVEYSVQNFIIKSTVNSVQRFKVGQ